jgi:ferrochelatase
MQIGKLERLSKIKFVNKQKNKTKKAEVGVLLLNMGGPDSLEAVEPFLYNLFSDHDIVQIPRVIQKPVAKLISKFRAKKVAKYYEAIGGKSPQTEQTFQQAEALQRLLGDRYAVEVGMRYWKPFIRDGLINLIERGVKQIILLPLYPQYSTTTTGSSLNEFYRIFNPLNKRLKLPIEVKVIKSYHNHPLYIKAMVENIKENLPNYSEYYLLFSAHSLPEKLIKMGDPYKHQTEITVKKIMEHFPDNLHSLAYQSKIGPVKWLEPMTDQEIKKIAKQGIKKLAIIPVSFVSEHTETLYELDIQYKDLAKEVGIEDFKRIPTLQTHPLFIETLKELVLKKENEKILKKGKEKQG